MIPSARTSASRPWLHWIPTVAQIGSVWLIGLVVTPFVYGALLIAALSGNYAVMLIPAAAMILGLYVVGSLTPAVSPMTVARGRRLVWSITVCLAGSAGWWAGLWVLAQPSASMPQNWPGILGGLPYALVAGVLMLRWTGLISLVLSGVLVIGGVFLFQEGRAEREATALAERVAPVRDLIYMVDIPGHQEAGRDSSWVVASFEPVDTTGVKVWQERTISLAATRGTLSACGGQTLAVAFGRDEEPSCLRERPGLWYLTGKIPKPKWGCPCGLHQYLRQDGGVLISVGASDAVPREVLRRAVLQARHATEADLRRLADPGGQ
ncbi:hypothetical protein [Nonomuraea dietziae]|uniref:hypothetical protein n=1 Tax=Nonomuraea dietziae TaxID=65515 RepID=UPI0033DC298F